MSLAVRLSDLAFAIGTDIKAIKVLITGSSTGNLTGLSTAAKDSLVNAINEINAKPTSGQPSDATDTVKGVVELADLTEVATGTDVTRAVTPAGVRQERTALKAEILGANVPGALDTLKELADAIADDANYAAGVTTALASRVRTDTAAQGLDATQMLNARTNISVYAKSDFGNPDTDLVAIYNTAKA